MSLFEISIFNGIMQYSLAELRAIPIFFIVGKGRSGTTLLSTILDSHPNVASATESRFLLLVWQKYKSMKKWRPEMADEFFISVLEDYRVKYLWEFEENFISQLKKMPPETTIQDLIKMVYIFRKSPFPKEKIKFIVDKNPRYTIFTGKLKSIFKEGKFIRIMRDPRDNITSHVRFTRKKAGYLSYKWLSYNLIIDKYSKLENDRFLTLRFEDLILDKMAFFKKFENFTEIDSLAELEEKRLNYKKEFEEKLSDDLKDQHQASVKPLDAKKIGHYKQKLDEIQIATIEAITFPYAQTYDYGTENKIRSLGLTEQLKLSLSFSFHKYGNFVLYNSPYWLLIQLRKFLIHNVFKNKKKKLLKVNS
ncbi:sulfotransferase [Vicingaceae bacterium]|nr:sulfotransferase [Vicingaceae bacterium]MDC1451147.1 sulfotransferase [Vicingaceae bacterium]